MVILNSQPSASEIVQVCLAHLSTQSLQRTFVEDLPATTELLTILQQHSDSPALTKELCFVKTLGFLQKNQMLKLYPISDLRHDFDRGQLLPRVL